MKILQSLFLTLAIFSFIPVIHADSYSSDISVFEAKRSFILTGNDLYRIQYDIPSTPSIFSCVVTFDSTKIKDPETTFYFKKPDGEKGHVHITSSGQTVNFYINQSGQYQVASKGNIDITTCGDKKNITFTCELTS